MPANRYRSGAQLRALALCGGWAFSGGATAALMGSVVHAAEAPAAPLPAAASPSQDKEVSVLATAQGSEPGHRWARGLVEVRTPGWRLLCDSFDLLESEPAGGKSQRTLTAEGNVVFMRDEERLAGTKLTMDLNTGRGALEDAVGYVQPQLFVHARRVERLDAQTLKVTQGTFTSCCQPDPRWSFWAPSATIKVGRHVRAVTPFLLAHNPPLVKRLWRDTPVLWLPYLYFPLTGRATGFLVPGFNIDTQRGVDVEPAFYWAMGRSMDQTFSYAFRAQISPRIGHEFRYAWSDRARGAFTSFLFPPDRAATATGEPESQGAPPRPPRWESDLSWQATQPLPLGLEAQLRLEQRSRRNNPQAEFEQIGQPRTRDATLLLNRRWSLGTLQAKLSASDTLGKKRTRISRGWPAFAFVALPRRLGHTGLVWKWETRADRFTQGEDVLATDEHPEQHARTRYGRYDAFSELSRPFGWAFLTVNPRALGRYTYYSTQRMEDVDGNRTQKLPIHRRFGEIGIQVNGPSFSRVLTSPLRSYTDRFKHVIGPELVWTFRSNMGGSGDLPELGRDGIDNLYGANSLQYGLTQTVWARRPAPGGKLAAYRVLSWRVYQTYYFNRSNYDKFIDPEYTYAAVGPSGAATRSPLRSDLQLTLGRGVGASWDVYYDPNYRQLLSSNVGANFQYADNSVSGTWARIRGRPTADGARDNDTWRASASVNVVPRQLILGGAVDYDARNRWIGRYSVASQVHVQCFGLLVRLRAYRKGDGSYTPQFTFSVELGSLGSIGTEPGHGGVTLGQQR